ncbi:FAD-dependent monooxygenase [Mycobacterium vicinigordonae]|uniref:FAD-dependent monooxygenase n=1 Tax=Mycobacterium vicinigordonae TaxID=1719132 RepID=A0A7D6E536_9MYCO|nr:FAD-dependent monooxygenase [Mycobacterium vicinigordonae]QLL09326.1 FAD-dependent monooxygenase [Mycobacterium vicinigordonae]
MRVPVLIVGAGAGGIATSALLAKYGVESLVVEKRREIFRYPKARNLSFRSLEILRALGLGGEVHAVAEGVSDMVVKPSVSSTEEHPALDIEAIFDGLAALSPEPPIQYCPQSRLEPILLRYLRSRGSRARYGVELTSFTQDDDGVRARVRDLETGNTGDLHADYLVAADGVHSPVRTQLGISTSGYGALPMYFVFVYFRAPWRALAPTLRDGVSVQVRNADVDGIFIAAEDDLGMFLASYLPDRGESAALFTRARCRELILAGVGEPIPVDVLDVTPWQPYEQVADRFDCARVFLVGDSAHAMPPLKAGGANVAIQSADNLAWKLAAVLQGWADPRLLGTYHSERHPVGRFSARQSLTGPALQLMNHDAYQPELRHQEEASMFSLLAGYQYRSAAVYGDAPGSARRDMALVDRLHGQLGTRVPHAWVSCRGERASTLDLLGPGFTLLSCDTTGGWTRAAALLNRSPRTPPVTVRSIDDPEGSWLRATGLMRDGALLVRPDAFVGWRAEHLPDDPAHELGCALQAISGQTASEG